jgi:hypothetical protein
MIKKIGDPICWKETMMVAWAMLFVYYSDPVQFAKDLMQAVHMITKMRDKEFDKLLNYYILLQDNIDKAGKAEQQDISRSSQHQGNDTSASLARGNPVERRPEMCPTSKIWCSIFGLLWMNVCNVPEV